MISDRLSDDMLPQLKNLNMVIPILMHFCSLSSKLEHCKPHKAARHQMICNIINDIKLFPTVYHCKFLMLSNQTSHCNI